MRFKKFYLLVPRRFETRVLEEMASLSSAQLIDAKELVSGEARSTEAYDRFLKLEQRCSALSGSLSSLRQRASGLSPPFEDAEGPALFPPSSRVNPADLGKTLDAYESRLDDLDRKIHALQREIDDLDGLRAKISILRALNIQLDALGEHTFTVVKAGVIGSEALQALDEPLASLSATHEESRTSAGESLVAVVVPKRNGASLEGLLAGSGFREIILPPGLDPDPKTALAAIEDQMRKKLRDSDKILDSLRRIGLELTARTEYVTFLKEADSLVSRTENLSVSEGWILESAVKTLQQRAAAITSDTYYFQVEDPRPGDRPPVLLAPKGWLMRGFELLTTVRGTPSYEELDPTIVFAVLFPIMYGIMFGDVGDGAVILGLGLLLYGTKSGHIGFSARSLKSLGTIMVVSGVSAMVFGVFYGSVFLSHALFRPLLFEPTSAFSTIVEVTLAFGVAQLVLSLVLNIVNKVSEGNYDEAIFSGKGVVGLSYYLLGIVLAVRLIQAGLNLSLFLSPANLPITGGALLCLLLVFVSPVIRSFHNGGPRLGENLIEGIGELLEIFISFLTNSLSYIRLAAFALAHSIFAGFAADLGTSIGLIPSLLIVNALVIPTDGFAAGIQSVRLLYYEFSTKFFAATGEGFKPLSIRSNEGGS